MKAIKIFGIKASNVDDDEEDNVDDDENLDQDKCEEQIFSSHEYH